MKNKSYTFWQLLSEKKVVIPIIQRDYAQGREGNENLRKSFLEQLGKSIGIRLNKDDKTEKDKDNKSILDFVYGTDREGTMYPIDGQQRLTTLWLLHWYVAFMAHKLDQARDVLEKFSYETRTSSREFCQKLCNLEYPKPDGHTVKIPLKIVDYITSKTWFFSAWNQDPTIQAMLRMLSGTNLRNKEGQDFIDGIEELFKDNSEFDKYWCALTEEDCLITFNFLPLQSNELPVSDDLYIKMNARGKALTDFENFKAEWVRWIYKEENSVNWGDDIDKERAEYASLIDNQWTDIFWRNNESGNIDEIYFAFLNRYFLNELILNGKDDEGKAITYEFLQNGDYLKNERGEKVKDEEHWVAPKDYDTLYGRKWRWNNQSKRPEVITNENGNDNQVSFCNFTTYEKILRDCPNIMNDLKVLFEKILDKEVQDCINATLPKWVNKDFRFIPEFEGGNVETFITKKIVKKITPITQKQRIIFYAICQYLIKSDSFDQTKFKQWNRVVCNIVENTFSKGFFNTLHRIREISDGCCDIYPYLISLPCTDDKQLNEEIEKAKQILNDEYTQLRMFDNENTWESIIEKAESTAFFKGMIRFLYTDDNGYICWDKEMFAIKLKNCSTIFNEQGLTDVYAKDYKANKVFISYCDEWKGLIEEDETCTLFGRKHETWKKNILFWNEAYAKPIHHLLCLSDAQSTNDFIKSDKVKDDIYRQRAIETLLNSNLLCDLGYKCTENSYVVWKNKFYLRTNRNYKDCTILSESLQRINILNNGNDDTLIIKNRLELIDNGIYKNVPISLSIKDKEKFKFYWWNRPGFDNEWIDMYVLNQKNEFEPKWEQGFHFQENQVSSITQLVSKMNELIDKYEEELSIQR